MMAEIVDVVDKNDNVIGQELKSKCHAEKLLHRCTNIFAFKDDSFKELLIQKRTLGKDIAPGRLCTPGGHVHAGEMYLDAAKREFFEEMYDSSVDDNLEFEELFKIRKYGDNDPEFMMVYRAVAPGPFYPDPIEVAGYYFEDIKKVFDDIENGSKEYMETTLELVKEYKKRYG
jgi:isopentenyldiphosphate isomerase